MCIVYFSVNIVPVLHAWQCINLKIYALLEKKDFSFLDWADTSFRDAWDSEW